MLIVAFYMHNIKDIRKRLLHLQLAFHGCFGVPPRTDGLSFLTFLFLGYSDHPLQFRLPHESTFKLIELQDTSAQALFKFVSLNIWIRLGRSWRSWNIRCASSPKGIVPFFFKVVALRSRCSIATSDRTFPFSTNRPFSSLVRVLGVSWPATKKIESTYHHLHSMIRAGPPLQSLHGVKRE